MSAVLIQISVAVGGIVFLLALGLSVAQGVAFLEAVFRAAIVMCLSTLVVALFFRFFSSILYKFVADKVMEHDVDPDRILEEGEEPPPSTPPKK